MKYIAVGCITALLVALVALGLKLHEPEQCWTGTVVLHSEEWGADLRFGNTKICGRGLHLTDIVGPDYETQIEELQRQLEATRGA